MLQTLWFACLRLSESLLYPCDPSLGAVLPSAPLVLSVVSPLSFGPHSFTKVIVPSLRDNLESLIRNEHHRSFICELSSYLGGWANEVCFHEYFCYFIPIRRWQISSVAIDDLGKVLRTGRDAERVAVLSHQGQGDRPGLCCPHSQCFN